MLTISLINLVFSLQTVASATHWVVTQDGRISPQMDSVFQLERPHDLMALLSQEDRTAKADLLKNELFKKKVDYEHHDDKDSSSMIEEKLYSTDPDCLKVGRKVTSMSIFESTHADFDFYEINLNQVMLPAEPGEQFPDCQQHPLDFSMSSFEHLPAIQGRKNLLMEAESILEKYTPDHMNLQQFASWVGHNLRQNSTSWIALNLATLYHRIMGNAYEAIECCRRALYFSPRKMRSIALVNMGNVLINSHHQEDGIIVLHAAVDHAPSDPITHYTLANSYALIGDLNRSVLCYENVLKLNPNLQMAIRKMHGIQCLAKLEKALETQHSVLQNTLTELKDQQRKFEEWNQLQERILNAQASVGQRLRSQLEYQELRFRTSNTPAAHDCEQYEEDGFMFFQCNIKTDISTLETWGSAMMDLRNRLVDFQTQTDKIVDLLSLRSTTANHSSHSSDISSYSSDIDNNLSTSESTSVAFNVRRQPNLKENFHDSLQELSALERHKCSMINLPKLKHMPSVLLPPELIGLDISEILNNKIGLRVDEDHPLPWYPPVCEKYPFKLLPYDELPSISKLEEINRRLRDIPVQRHLLRYVRTDIDEMLFTEDSNDDIQSTAAYAQVGQRILTALRNKVDHPWLLYTLAGLYWRGHGRYSNSIECFRQALTTVPEDKKHVPLTNLAGMLFKLGIVEDALLLTTAAHLVDLSEPNTNFLLGLIHLQLGNYSTAFQHFHQTLLSESSEIQPSDIHQYKLLSSCLAIEQVPIQPMKCQDPEMASPYRVLRCTKIDESSSINQNCEIDIQDHTSSPISLEVATVADNEDDVFADALDDEQKFVTPDLVLDDPLPDGLLRKGKFLSPMPLTRKDCEDQKIRLRSRFTSTWLSVAAKNIDFKRMLPKSVPLNVHREPVCDSTFPVTMATFDHLTGVRLRNSLDYRSESALEEAFNALVFDKKQIDTDQVARYLSYALDKNSTSWELTTAASLYWRIKGNAKNAIDCLRIALHHAPYPFKDIPLVSLANILHRASMFNGALIATYMALEISPTFVIIHFTAANIHAARGDVVRALSFYQSTLDLQPSFEPARQQMIELQCKQLLFEQQQPN